MTHLKESHVGLWREGAEKRPPEMSDASVQRATSIRAISIVAMGDGIGLRMQAGNGDVADVYLNPVVAMQIARSIIKGGTQEGWLDADLKLVVSPD